MGKVKQISNDMINVTNVHLNLLKIDKKNITKGLIFTTLDTLKLKKLII